MGNTISATFGLDINPLKAGFNKAIALSSTAASTMARNMVGLLAPPLAGLAVAAGAALSLNALRNGVQNVVVAGAELEKLHKQTGISVGGLSTLRGTFDQGHVFVDLLGASIAKMQRFLFSTAASGDKAVAPMLGLGLDVGMLVKAKPDVKFTAIGKA